MTDRLSEIEKRLAAATPGPWKADDSCDVYSTTAMDDSPETVKAVGHPIGRTFFSARYGEQHMRDCEFIASAPDDMRYLLQLIKTRDAQLAVARGFLERYRKYATESEAFGNMMQVNPCCILDAISEMERLEGAHAKG